MHGAVKLLIGVVAGVVGVRYFLIFFERSNLYFPTRAIEATPREIGLAYEDVRLTASDGVTIHGWYIPATIPLAPKTPPPGRASKPARLSLGAGGPATGPRRGILFFHGNAGNISHRLQTIRIFHDLGLDTLIIDYRGYGKSAGRPSEKGLYLDAEAAYDWLRARPGTDPGSIVAFGRSLGGAVAVECALRRKVSALIVESAFTSTADIGREVLPFLPVRLLVTQKFDSIGKIGSITVPKLFIHGRDDEIIPFSHGKRLFEAAAEPKRFVPLAGGHNDGFILAENDYPAVLGRFLAEHPGAGR
ncbi:MAG: alpha/beta hydrolase [Chlamydiota bacterium]